MYKVRCKIEGDVPIMFSRFPVPKKPNDLEKKKPQTLKEKVWLDKKGMYIPTDNLRMILIGNRYRTGAAKIQGSVYESKRGKQYLDFCKACVWVTGLDDSMKVYFEPNRKTWDETDIRSFITANGGRDVVERPIIKPPWSLTFDILVTEDTVSSEKMHKFYTVGGFRCGLGAYGPTFGRYQVTDWQLLNGQKKS